jgi:acetyl esterase
LVIDGQELRDVMQAHRIFLSIMSRSTFVDGPADPDDSLLNAACAEFAARAYSPDAVRANLAALAAARAGDLSQITAIRARLNVPNVLAGVTMTLSPIPFKDRSIPVRHFSSGTPSTLPLIVYIHGGGWSYGRIGPTSWFSSQLVLHHHVDVAAIDYSLAPETQPGVALEECLTVYKALSESRPIILLGDSAGGNFSSALTLKIIADKSIRQPTAVILLYPAVDVDRVDTESFRRFATGYGLTAEMTEAYNAAYVPDPALRRKPDFSPLYGDMKGFPQTLLMTAQFDVLRDQGRDFAQKLDEAGTTVRYICLEGAVHACLTTPDVADLHEVAQEKIKNFLAEIKPANPYFTFTHSIMDMSVIGLSVCPFPMESATAIKCGWHGNCVTECPPANLDPSWTGVECLLLGIRPS